MTKSELRSHFKKILAQQSAVAESMSLSQAKLVQNIFSFLKSCSGTWGTYVPLPLEASVQGIAEGRRDIRWVYPRMQSVKLGQPNGALEFCLPELWENANFGIQQPAEGCQQIALEEIQGMLIPGLAFDRVGNRLGRGKGFYDQTLESFGGIKVGIAYSWQVYEETIPSESHDVKMNWIITEDSVVKC